MDWNFGLWLSESRMITILLSFSAPWFYPPSSAACQDLTHRSVRTHVSNCKQKINLKLLLCFEQQMEMVAFWCASVYFIFFSCRCFIMQARWLQALHGRSLVTKYDKIFFFFCIMMLPLHLGQRSGKTRPQVCSSITSEPPLPSRRTLACMWNRSTPNLTFPLAGITRRERATIKNKWLPQGIGTLWKVMKLLVWKTNFTRLLTCSCHWLK